MKLRTLGWLGATAIFVNAGAHAADCGPEKAAASMSEAVYYGVDEANKLIAKKQMDDAIEKLAKLSESGSDFDKAVVYYNLGFAYSSKPDYPNAVKAFAKAIGFEALPRQDRKSVV